MNTFIQSFLPFKVVLAQNLNLNKVSQKISSEGHPVQNIDNTKKIISVTSTLTFDLNMFITTYQTSYYAVWKTIESQGDNAQNLTSIIKVWGLDNWIHFWDPLRVRAREEIQRLLTFPGWRQMTSRSIYGAQACQLGLYSQTTCGEDVFSSGIYSPHRCPARKTSRQTPS